MIFLKIVSQKQHHFIIILLLFLEKLIIH